MAEDETPLKKLVDDRLRAFATEETDARMSVFVEVAGSPDVVVGIEERPGVGRRPSVRVRNDVGNGRNSSEEVQREAAALLARQTGEEPVWLSAARAFVVSATPEQLVRLAESPLVKRISRNRRLG